MSLILMKRVGCMLLVLLVSSACATVRQGTVKYVEFDLEMKEYPEDRSDVITGSECGFRIVNYPTILNRMRPQDNIVGLRNFEFYTDSCFNVRGEAVQ